MDVEKIGPISPGDKDKKTKKSDPDSEAFKEMMKVGKVSETELEKGKKRKQFLEEDEESKEKTPSAKTSPKAYHYKNQEKAADTDNINSDKNGFSFEKPCPHSPSFYKELSKKKADLNHDKKILYAIEKELKEKKIKKQASLHKEKTISTKGQKIKESSLETTSKSQEEEKIKTIEKEKAKKEQILGKEKTKNQDLISSKKTQQKEKSNNAITTEKQTDAIIYQTIQLNEIAQTKATAIVEQAQSYFNKEISPIFEHMIGTIIQMQSDKIQTTHIILNNPKFAHSRFFGTRITFEKYSTAPDSYNITLTGSQEAVTIFNNNIEGLYKTLKTANLDFDIGRLSVEYKTQKPLFKRKKSSGDIAKENKENKN